MSAVVTVCKREVDALVESHVHCAPYKRLYRVHVIVNRVFYILNFAAVHKVPEPLFKVLFLNRRDVLGNMTVKAVAYIFAVGDILDNSVFCAELLYLKSAKALRGRAVERIEPAVRLLELADLFVDVFHNLNRKLSVLGNRFLVVQLLQLIERGYAERCGSGFKERLNLVVDSQVSAVETAFAVCKRVC